MRVTIGSNDFILRDGSQIQGGHVQTFSDLIRQREGILTRQDNQLVSRLRYGWYTGIGWSRQDRETGRGEFGLRDSTANTLHRFASLGILNESQTHGSDADHARKYVAFKSDWWALFEENGPDSVTTGVAVRRWDASTDTWGGGGAVGSGIRAYDMVHAKDQLVALVGTLDSATDNIDVYTSTDGVSWSAASGTGWTTYDAGTPVGRTTNPHNDDYAKAMDFGDRLMIAAWDEDGSGDIEIQYTTDKGGNWTAGAVTPSGSGPKAFVRWLDPFSNPPTDSPVLITAEGIYRVDSAGATSDRIYELDGNENNGRWSVVGLDGDLYVGLAGGEVIALHAEGGTVVVRTIGPPGDGLVDERRGRVNFMLAPPVPYLIVSYGGHGPLEQASIFAIDYVQRTDPDTGRIYQAWHSLYQEPDANQDIVALGYSTEDDSVPRLHFTLEGASADEMYHLEHPFTNPQLASPRVEFDAATDAVGGGNSVTSSHTIGDYNDRFVTASVFCNDATETTPASVTYAGVAMTQLGTTTTVDGDTSLSLWYLDAEPAVGAGDCVATYGSACDKISVGVMSFYNVNQTAPLNTFNSAAASSTLPSVTITSTSGDMVFDALGVADTAHTITIGAGQTQRYDGSPSISGSTKRAVSSSTTMSATLNATRSWIIMGAALQPVGRVYQQFQTTSTMQFAEDDMGDPHNDACVHQVRMEAENLSATTAGEYIDYKFGVDGGAWDTTDLGDFLSGDLDLVHGSGDGVAAKTLRNELVLHRDAGETTDTPLIKDFEVMATKTQQLLRQMTVDIDLTETAVHIPETGTSPEAVLLTLEAALTSTPKFTFKIGGLADMKARVRLPAEWRLQVSELGGGDGLGLGQLHGIATVSVEEVLEGSPQS